MPQPAVRILALDAMRGLAVVLMIEQHLGVWLWRGPAPGHTIRSYPLLVAFNALGGLAAPLFVTLAGIGASLLAHRRPGEAARVLVRRGGALLGLGYVLNLLTPSWFSWGSWFVLHMMGFSMVAAPRLVHRRAGLLLAAGALVLAATAQLQASLHTPFHLTNRRMSAVDLAGGPFRLALAEGHFPIFPWFYFYLMGMLAGRAILANHRRRVLHLGLASLVVGSALAILHLARVLPRDGGFLDRLGRVRLGFYPASPATALFLCGLALVLCALALGPRASKWWSPGHPLVHLGRGSLTLLFVHVVVFREWSRPVGLWRALSAPAALALLGLTLAAAAWAARAWSRVGYRFGAEWLLRKAAP